MIDSDDRFTVLHGKFAAYLSWSQPFIHNLVSGLGEYVRNVIICNRTENLDRFPTPNVVRLKTRYLVNPTLAVLASSFLHREHHPNVLHAHFGWSGIRMLLLRQFMRIPLVTTFGGRDVGVQMQMEHFDELYRLLLEMSDQLICVSQDLKDQLVARGVEPERIEVIRRGTNLRQFRFIDRTARDPNAPVEMLMVGRLVEKKGHTFVFEALKQFVDEGRNVRLTIVGEGESYHQLRKLRDSLGLKNHINLAGSTNHEGVRNAMERADLFLHCSVVGKDGDCEGIPNVVVEAAATGLPVIGTRHGGIIEPIEHERTGLLVEERDVPAMIEAMRRLTVNRAERLELGSRAAEEMRRDWDLDKQIAQHRAIYEKLGVEFAGDSERMQRIYIPPDFAQIASRAIQSSANVGEFSLAELAESLVNADGLSPRIVAPTPGLLERTYELKRYLPQPIKYPLKVTLGRAMNVLLRRRRASRAAEWEVKERELNRRVLEYFESGGEITEIKDGWRTGDLDQMLSKAAANRADDILTDRTRRQTPACASAHR